MISKETEQALSRRDGIDYVNAAAKLCALRENPGPFKTGLLDALEDAMIEELIIRQQLRHPGAT